MLDTRKNDPKPTWNLKKEVHEQKKHIWKK